MGDSEDEFREFRGRLKAAGPEGGRRRPRPTAAAAARGGTGKAQDGGGGDVARGRREPASPASPASPAAPEEEEESEWGRVARQIGRRDLSALGAARREQLGPSGLKRKGASSAERWVKKRKRPAKADGVTEDLLVAMAMSRSLLEEEEKVAQWLTGGRQEGALQSRRPRTGAKKRRAKPGLPRSPPLLLLQDPQEARQQMATRVAQLLSEAEDFPSTPPLPPSRLVGAGGSGGALWEASSLAGRCLPGSFQATDFARSVSLQAPEESAQPGEVLPSSGPAGPAETEPVAPGAALPHGSVSGAARERLPCRLGDAEALQDLVELAGEGLTLTQWQQEGPGQGWPPGDLLQSGFLPPLEKRLRQRSGARMLPLVSLAGAFRGMVNSPHLSDIQFQVDTGEILYAHLFVLYARCPQLMELVAREGFLVAEEGGAGTRRVLLSDVSREALGVLMSHLYAADVSVPCPARPEVAALARRFGVTELAGACGCRPGLGAPGAEEAAGEDRAETFEELLKSMWLEEEEEEEEALLQDGQPEEAEAGSEDVGEQELEEIYAFAASQRKAAHEGPRSCQGAASPRKAQRETPAGRAARAERRGGLGREQARSPAADARGTGGALGAAAGREPQVEAEENWEPREDSAVLFPATQGDFSGLSQRSGRAKEQRGSAARQVSASQGFPSLLQPPPSPLSPLGSSSPSSPSELLPLLLPGSRPGTQSAFPPLGGSPIVLLDSDEEDERADAAFSGPHAGPLQSQLSQGGANVSGGQRPSLPPPREVGPGGPLAAGERSPLLLRLGSDGEAGWEEASTWRVPDIPLLGGHSSSPLEVARPTLAPGTDEQGPRGAGESPPTRSPTTRPPRLGPACSPVVVVGDSEEELDCAAPWPQRSTLGPAEDTPSPLEEEADSFLCLTAEAPTPLGTPPPAWGGKGKCPPAGSPIAAPHLGERAASTGEDSDGSEVFPLTQKTPDFACEAGSETPIAAPPTPMPSYSIMETPKLRKELSRFGVRALPKRKMILKLKEIFQYTHQEAKGAAASQLALPPSPAQLVPRKPRLALASSPVGKRRPGSAEPRQITPGSQSVRSLRDPPGQVAEPPFPGRLQGAASLPTGFPPGESIEDAAPTASQESTASSGTGSDVSVASQSSSSVEFSSPVEEEEEEEEVPASQAAAREAHKLEALRHYLGSQPTLCRQILLYQPIELAGLQAELKQNGVKIALAKLMDFLDAHCITFTTAEARREKRQRSKKRRRRF